MSTDPKIPHELGRFAFAKSLTFTVFGDDPHHPDRVTVMLDDGVQEPYEILAVESLDRFTPPPVATWRDGWIAPTDSWTRIVYGNTIGVIRQARARLNRT
ncbi:hypothetical protein [Glycomyces arizonensis]|uniref:hypothetical protein n=1 Tax=Glycomyces arizonensis TaxID=256035 RepID=UPI000425DD2C|nr:hypothetical protein [Glycomyces arizonensis]